MIIRKATQRTITQRNQSSDEIVLLNEVKAAIREVALDISGESEARNVIEYLLKKSGKLLRAKIILRGCLLQRTEYSQAEAISTASAIELIHLASLVHDDVMDEGNYRRGVKTVNHKWNSKIAVIAGDFLIAEAVKKIAQLENSLLNILFAQTAHEMSKGQLYESTLKGKFVSMEEYFRIARGKTGSLFGLAFCIPSVLKGNYKSFLYEAGVLLGECFQIKDDLIDIDNASSSSGKDHLADVRNGVMNYPIILLAQLKELFDYERVFNLISKTEDFLKVISSLKIVDRCEEEIENRLAKAETMLNIEYGENTPLLISDLKKHLV